MRRVCKAPLCPLVGFVVTLLQSAASNAHVPKYNAYISVTGVLGF